MTTTTTGPAPRTATLDHETAMRLAATEYERCAAVLRGLSAEQWSSPTDCPGWTVHEMAAHMLGMAEMAASPRAMIHQQRAAGKRDGELIDALTAVQVEERSRLSTAELVDRFARTAPKAARARGRTPALVRARTMPGAQPTGEDGGAERWTLGYLLDVILTRDPWMHRIDLARATGRELLVTADHDGVLVADVVAEWSGRHAQPYSLRLTGPAGGEWSSGSGGPEITMDAVEFCRVLSGRGAAQGLLATRGPF